MSTTFEVYPRTKVVPTFAQLIERSTRELHRFLDDYAIAARPKIQLRLQACTDHAHIPFSLDGPARWSKETYAWFEVGDVPGGTDAYYEDDADQIQEYL